jgi:DNA polymerase
MSLAFCDTETYSDVDISAGTDRYTRSATCLIVTYALDAGPVKIWQPWCDPIPPADLMAAVHDPSVLFVAHNSAFDRLIFARCLHITIPVSRWRCTMAAASAHGLPGSLEALGSV